MIVTELPWMNPRKSSRPPQLDNPLTAAMFIDRLSPEKETARGRSGLLRNR